MTHLERFSRQQSGALLARFEPIEADLLRLATSQLLELLGAGAADPELAASDGLFTRLLPAAYRDDTEAAAEFRRFTASSLLERKVENARVVLDTLTDGAGGAMDAAGHAAQSINVDGTADDRAAPDCDSDPSEDLPVTVSLDPAAVQAWLRSLTDLRLTLADRLRISADGLVQLTGDEAPFLRELYEWLGMLQEELVYAIDV